MTIELDTPRLRLRELGPEDAPFIVELLNDRDFLQNIGDRGVRDAGDAQRYLRDGPMASYRRHGHGLLAVEVVHRTGRMGPGEPIVWVACAAAHRRAAFEACDRLMDHLKSRAPFWKKAHLAGGGSRWIEPTAQDYEDARRWDAREETP